MKPLVAQTPGMLEFDPELEVHLPLLYVKAVDPGCTWELQIELAHSGKVIRLTTTDSDLRDRKAFEKALVEAFWLAWTERTR